MKHLLPFVTGFVTFMIVSGVYYMGMTEMPTGGCFPDEPDMAVMMLGNALYVALTAYIIHLWGFIVPIDGAMALQDIVANIPMMAATGAAIAFMYARGEAKNASVA
jgi:hypothetical protein